MYLIPAPGFKVPDPAFLNTPGDHLPPEGRDVEPSTYWTRRINDGDVTVGVEPTPEPETEPAA